MPVRISASCLIGFLSLSAGCLSASRNVGFADTHAQESRAEAWCAGGREIGTSGLQIVLPSEIVWSDRLLLPVRIYNGGPAAVWLPANLNLRFPDNLPQEGEFEVRLKGRGATVGHIGTRDIIFPATPVYRVLNPGGYIEVVLMLDAAEFSIEAGVFSLALCYDDQTGNIPTPPTGAVREASRVLSREVLVRKH